MYIRLVPEELALLVAALAPIGDEKVLKDRLENELDVLSNQPMQDLFKKYRDGAEQNFAEDGKIEVDDDVLVALGDDAGAYVMVWH